MKKKDLKEIHALIIGDEILSGKRQDKHLNYLTKKLNSHGLSLKKAEFISDDLKLITEAIKENKDSILFCFGGIGATPDDCTREAAAIANNMTLKIHPEAKKAIEERFGKDTYPKRILMAYLPENCSLLKNVVNNVPGFSIDDHHFMPGFPEMAWPMSDWIILNHYRDLSLNHPKKLDLSIWLDNVSESLLIDVMHKINNEYKNVKTYSLPRLKPSKTLELGVKGDNSEVKEAMKALKNNLKDLSINWKDT
tara:strand:- start:674 stop:1426 length:753 start_codon:yes stop_codon:yes gene_type:complete